MEESAYQTVPDARDVSNAEVQMHYQRIKAEIKGLLEQLANINS